MDLQKRLQNEVLRNANVKLLASETWGLPVHSVEITYETVKRTPMDILMKMLLISFRKGRFQTAEEVSQILLVESLFIEDMIDAMIGAGLIVKNKDGYSLTDAGSQQLESGIYVQSPERQEKTAYFSPIHNTFLVGEIKESRAKSFRLTNNEWRTDMIPESSVREILEKLQEDEEEEYGQTSIHAVKSVTELELHSVECIEFRLHQVADDRMYARVWNTMTGEWDQALEQFIIEQELSDWRKTYK
ncbi:hypothetical protein NCCP2222_28250 [Sporosarcina sp. NCCP-2222]|uniref:hypothetical protein n=1 Tax=Sporosarcina sp. NCCP-2222 TaxID=2935073 RepID=UPI0020864DBE|nr:hypothetical protein [Sporosarcina sp. NCCP-2222]GKV56878.1 hypothetical protein NCCP2222_28250 [Sporosarcina sp. NCCP-2222]